MIYAGEVQEREDLSHPIRRQLEAESETRSPAEHDLVAGLNQQLQLEIAEKERLRRELELARAKLEAIAALESAKIEPQE